MNRKFIIEVRGMLFIGKTTKMVNLQLDIPYQFQPCHFCLIFLSCTGEGVDGPSPDAMDPLMDPLIHTRYVHTTKATLVPPGITPKTGGMDLVTGPGMDQTRGV